MNRTIFLLCILALAVGCDRDGSSEEAEPTAEPSPSPSPSPEPTAAPTAEAAEAEEEKPEPYNVLLLTIDSMRHDMPWHGYDRDIAPNLTKLAKESIVYDNAYTISSFTSKSVGGLLAGRYPSTLYRGCTFFTEYSKANTFFPELLQKEGVRTLAGHAHLYFDRGKRLRQGFDEWRLVDDLTWNPETDESVTSPQLTDLAIDMLGEDENTSGPFFAWFHYMDPHDQYVRHEEAPDFGRKARDLYDNEVHFTDMHVQRLLDWAEKQPWWDRTVLVISSDHGEAFGEHGMWKHAFALWEVLTHVPLIVKVPGGEPRRIEERRSHIDFAPTFLELLGVEPPEDLAGTSMASEWLNGAEADDREPILLELPADSYNPPTKAILEGDYKLIRDPGDDFQLYDVSEDPGETRNLVGVKKHADALARMKKSLEEELARHEEVTPYGSCKLVAGGRADGPEGPPGWEDPDEEKE